MKAIGNLAIAARVFNTAKRRDRRNAGEPGSSCWPASEPTSCTDSLYRTEAPLPPADTRSLMLAGDWLMLPELPREFMDRPDQWVQFARSALMPGYQARDPFKEEQMGTSLAEMQQQARRLQCVVASRREVVSPVGRARGAGASGAECRIGRAFTSAVSLPIRPSPTRRCR